MVAEAHSLQSPTMASPRTADRMVAWLEAQGVERVFGIPGGAIAPLFDAFADSPIEVVVCQHEQMAAYLASGEALETGRPGVVLATAGPGVLNTVTAVAAAYEDELPLLVISGEVRSPWAGGGALQDGAPGRLDIGHLFTPITRHRGLVERAETAVAALADAWNATLQHPRGPALLRVPVDICGGPCVRSVHVCDVPTTEAPEWDDDAIHAMVRHLVQAERPAILAGVGARSAGLRDALHALAERLACPILTDLDAKSLVDETHPCVMGVVGPGQSPAATATLQRGIDVLLVVGSRIDDTTTHGFEDALRPTTALLQIDHDPARIDRTWPSDVSACGDLAAIATALLAAVPTLASDVVETRRRALRTAPPIQSSTPFRALEPSRAHDPRRVITDLQAAYPNATFFTDIGNHLLFATRHLVSTEEGTYHAGFGLGGMGSGIGRAMGTASARSEDDAPVVCVCGDGGTLMVGTELATAAKYGIPAVFCIFDDALYGMVDAGMRTHYGRAESTALPTVDLVAFAKALGVSVVDVKDASDLTPPEGHRGPLVLRVAVDSDVQAPNPRLASVMKGTASTVEA